MSAYRFCRTDDIGLLVDALNRCWAPYSPDEPPMTPEAFKRSIRDLQVWCSSCMVAFAGSEPIGVLIGAKRTSATLIHRIAVHPDHVRQGHGRHLLTSLASKLAILGPPRIVAEIPDALAAACGLFDSTGYVREAVVTDYVMGQESSPPSAEKRFFLIPTTVDDLAANGLLDDGPASSWGRSVETLTARKNEISGLAVASDEGIEAYILYIQRPDATEILSLRSTVDDGGARLGVLLAHLRTRGIGGFTWSRVHPAEISSEWLASLGFRSAGRYVLYGTSARST